MSEFGIFVSSVRTVSSIWNGRLYPTVSGKLQVVGESIFTGSSHSSHALHSTNEDWYIRSGKAAGKVIIQDTGGNVGIGTSSPGYKLDVNGTCQATDFNATSDQNLKENICPLDSTSMLHKICNIQGFSFQFKKDSASDNEDNIKKTKLGVIAQNIEEEFPELVTSIEDKPKTVNYNGFVGPFIECIKELNRKNDELVQKNDDLNNELMITVESMKAIKAMMLSMREELDALKKH